MDPLGAHVLPPSAPSRAPHLGFIYEGVIPSDYGFLPLCLQVVRDMDVTQIYAIAAGGLFFVSFILQLARCAVRIFLSHCIGFLLKHLIYLYVLRRHRLIGPISREDLLYQTCYWGVTAACNIISVQSMLQASSRAGTLSAIHLIPLFFSGRLNHVADLLGLSLYTFHRIHRSIEIMAVTQGLLHVLILVQRTIISVKVPFQFYGILV